MQQPVWKLIQFLQNFIKIETDLFQTRAWTFIQTYMIHIYDTCILYIYMIHIYDTCILYMYMIHIYDTCILYIYMIHFLWYLSSFANGSHWKRKTESGTHSFFEQSKYNFLSVARLGRKTSSSYLTSFISPWQALSVPWIFMTWTQLL